MLAREVKSFSALIRVIVDTIMILAEFKTLNIYRQVDNHKTFFAISLSQCQRRLESNP